MIFPHLLHQLGYWSFHSCYTSFWRLVILHQAKGRLLFCFVFIDVKQEQEVDWFANPWQAIMEMPETFVHPVQTISQGTPYGVHDFKVMVVETKCEYKCT